MTTEHYTLLWKTKFEDDKYHVITDEDEPWHICTMDECLPGDPDGSATAMFICKTHNALLLLALEREHESEEVKENKKLRVIADLITGIFSDHTWKTRI